MLVDSAQANSTSTRSKVVDDELAACFLPPVVASDEQAVGGVPVKRSLLDKQNFGPFIQDLTWDELDRMEKDRDRDARYVVVLEM